MTDNYFARYLPLLIHVLMAAAIAGGMVLISALVGVRRPSRAKYQAYECGITPTGSARERFSVKFYLVGMLFIVFDIEAVFLYPWVVVYRDLKMFGFIEMAVFVVLILSGFFYIWKKGALDWAAEPGRVGRK